MLGSGEYLNIVALVDNKNIKERISLFLHEILNKDIKIKSICFYNTENTDTFYGDIDDLNKYCLNCVELEYKNITFELNRLTLKNNTENISLDFNYTNLFEEEDTLRVESNSKFIEKIAIIFFDKMKALHGKMMIENFIDIENIIFTSDKAYYSKIFNTKEFNLLEKIEKDAIYLKKYSDGSFYIRETAIGDFSYSKKFDNMLQSKIREILYNYLGYNIK